MLDLTRARTAAMPRAMPSDLADTLPLAQRLALTYAPRAARAPALALLALDQRLGSILRGGGQTGEGWTIIAQIKLAWWRDRLGEPTHAWPAGEPLLELLRDFPGGAGGLGEVVDAWEVLLNERLDAPAIAQFAQGRARGWLALGGAGARPASQQWVLADLLLHLPDGDDADAVRAILNAEPWSTARLPRAVRPLAVLHALARRALRRQAGELLDSPGALVTAMRVGIIGA